MANCSRLSVTMHRMCSGVRKLFGSLQTAVVFIAAIYTVVALYGGGAYLRLQHSYYAAEYAWLASITLHSVALANFFLIFGVIANKIDFVHAWLALHVITVTVFSILWIWVPIASDFNNALVYLIATPIAIAGMLIVVTIVYGLSLEMQYGPRSVTDGVTDTNKGWVENVTGQPDQLTKDSSQLPAVFISSTGTQNRNNNQDTNVMNTVTSQF